MSNLTAIIALTRKQVRSGKNYEHLMRAGFFVVTPDNYPNALRGRRFHSVIWLEPEGSFPEELVASVKERLGRNSPRTEICV